MEQTPKISVLMPVYNGEKYLKESIQCILSQTFTNFELIIIDDGSTDASFPIMEKFNDSRIRIYRQPNRGLAATLNRAIGLANGKYLARQDQDDFSFPLRFEKQITFLENNPDYGMVGAWAEILGEKPTPRRFHRHPVESLNLKFYLLFNNPFVHSAVMIRKKVIEQIGLYSIDKLRQPPEDYELWSRIAKKFEVANIPEVLVIYREVKGSMCRTETNPFTERVLNICIENIAWASERETTDPAVRDIAALSHNAIHKLSPRPNFRKISEVLDTAAHRLSTASAQKDSVLRKQVSTRYMSIRIIYYRYILGSFIKTFFKPLYGSIFKA